MARKEGGVSEGPAPPLTCAPPRAAGRRGRAARMRGGEAGRSAAGRWFGAAGPGSNSAQHELLLASVEPRGIAPRGDAPAAIGE